MLWYTKLVLCPFAYFCPQSTLKNTDWQFSHFYVCNKLSICTKLQNHWRASKSARLFWVYIVLVIYKFVARHHVCTRWRQTKVFEYLIIGILHPVLGWKLVIIYSMFSSFKGWHMFLEICSSMWIILPWWTRKVA